MEQQTDNNEQETDNNEQQTDNNGDTTKKTTVSMEGSRVINMEKLKQYTADLNKHSTRCEGSITLSNESRAGLASVLTGHCSNCEHTIRLETSKGPKDTTGGSATLLRCGGRWLQGQAIANSRRLWG